MNDFSTYYPDAVNLEPHKRVNYVHGLVLGVDEFLQEELYLLARQRRHHRGLHGYGTVYGLDVRLEEVTDDGATAGHRIIVRSGLAVSPQGQEICVPQDQCALLEQWLLQNRAEIETTFGPSPAGPISLYLTLCYSQCRTDHVPVPSGPCQSLEETSAPSRVADDFVLKFTTTAPDQMEADETGSLLDFLRQITISDASPGIDEPTLLDLVRSLAGLQSPPAGSPPPGGYTLHPDNAPAYLRSALRVWITEVRPHLLAETGGCTSGDNEDGCVQLARLEFGVNLTGQGYQPVAPITLDQSRRPCLLSSRLTQEAVLSRLASVSGGGESGVTAHNALSGLGAGDDHPQYLLADGNKPLGGNLNANRKKITNLQDATAALDALNLRTAQARFMNADGDGLVRVAAGGRIKADGSLAGPVYNRLRVVSREANGTFVLHFFKYVNPDRNNPPKHSYVVRGSVEGAAQGTFQVLAFGNDGIHIQSRSVAARPVPMGFTVEVTEIS